MSAKAVQLQAREVHLEAALGSVMTALQAEQGNLAAKTARVSVGDDPMRCVSASELGSMMGVTDETVRARERNREIFSVLRAGRKRGREYPVFQAWPGIAGAPLQQVMKALSSLDPSDLFGFFAGVTDLLVGITPVEALMGKLASQRPIDESAQALLDSPLQARLGAVLEAAEGLLALRAA